MVNNNSRIFYVVGELLRLSLKSEINLLGNIGINIVRVEETPVGGGCKSERIANGVVN